MPVLLLLVFLWHGYLVGSLVGGVLFDVTPRKQFLMTVFNFLIAVSLLAVPWCRSMGTIAGWLVINGLSMGALDTGLNVCCLNLWGQDCGPFYQALHFMYGFGSLLAPLIASPFLDDYHETTSVNDSMSFTCNTSTWDPVGLTVDTTNILTWDSVGLTGNISNGYQNDKFPSITYAYTIIGIYAFVVTVAFFIVCIISPLDASGNKNEANKTKQNGFMFISMIVTLTFLLLFFETGTEIGFAQMVTAYSVKGPLKLTAVVGSYITSAYWAAFTLSRFSSIFLAIKFSSLSVVVLDLTFFTAGTIVLLFWAGSKEWCLWLATILLGIGIASLYATVITWVERYIDITNKVLGLFATGAAFGEMVIPLTISWFLGKSSRSS
ncbi:major facilitator superfamily domain-containing protein 4A [Caerostris extrusa]|uniref:Major facilitator superfamily domain-containing protein 4A n=1 Tax=Caerostris extrusa TaxID=172846 RepID=A0AAV4W0I8_CAEEX|nr:major facilitator superfamily domain-containing protein 4A [Caerostris extrusa]